jgi:hypothetical protein
MDWEREMALPGVPGDRRAQILDRIVWSRAMLAHPPFPVYCLDESWPHSRVRSGGGFSGGLLAGLRAVRGDWSRLTVSAVNVDHAGAGGATVRVTSMPRRLSSGGRARRAMLGHRLGPALAGQASAVEDGLSVDANSELWERTAAPLRWRPGRIVIDGRSVSCEVAERGGRWAVSAETVEVSLMLVGAVAAPADIALVRIDGGKD